MNKFFFIILLFPFCLLAQSSNIDKDKNPYRRGADPAEPAQFLATTVWPEIDKHFQPGNPNACGRYELVGSCVSLTRTPRIKPMWSYYVPFQLTEHSNRPGASRLTMKEIIKQELEMARKMLEQSGPKLAKENSQLIEQQGKGLKGIKEESSEYQENLKKYQEVDIDFGDLETEGKSHTPIYSSVFDSGWHNFARDRNMFKSIKSPFTWCHEHTHEAYNGKTDRKQLVPRFSSLGPQALLYTFFRLLTYQNQDLSKLTLKSSEVQNCDGKREKSGKVPKEIFEAKRKMELVNDEQSNVKCPGDGHLGQMNFTRFTNSLYRAFTSLGKSASILYMAWYLDKAGKDKRHHLKATKEQSEEPGEPHHLQMIWPKPDGKYGEAWQGGCEDTLVKNSSGPQSHYSVPKMDLPTDYMKASEYDSEESGNKNYDLFIFAHYVNVVCCPKGYMPISSREIKLR